ncbi:MAG TPA: GNAT family N-acetyltransferase [Victivallales bacterium]|nr:GNAT family N-acetyltransferase [Victivallales bacterium]HPO89707.1 GNAT family N-acetyltransferase [Victivallales bacterium]HRU00191.1 GNAT family N-acetyltransferase [Victivallales bacterium]
MNRKHNITATVKIKKVKKVKVSDFKDLYKDAGWWYDEYDKNLSFINKAVKGSYCFVGAFNNKGKMIGMGRAISDGCSDAYIQDLTVLKKYRGKGIGKMIVNEIIRLLKKNGIDWIALISEPKSIGFHSKNGFMEMKKHLPMKLKN